MHTDRQGVSTVQNQSDDWEAVALDKPSKAPLKLAADALTQSGCPSGCHYALRAAWVEMSIVCHQNHRIWQQLSRWLDLGDASNPGVAHLAHNRHACQCKRIAAAFEAAVKPSRSSLSHDKCCMHHHMQHASHGCSTLVLTQGCAAAPCMAPGGQPGVAMFFLWCCSKCFAACMQALQCTRCLLVSMLMMHAAVWNVCPLHALLSHPTLS
jgi:hypothetical protein